MWTYTVQARCNSAPNRLKYLVRWSMLSDADLEKRVNTSLCSDEVWLRKYSMPDSEHAIVLDGDIECVGTSVDIRSLCTQHPLIRKPPPSRPPQLRVFFSSTFDDFKRKRQDAAPALLPCGQGGGCYIVAFCIRHILQLLLST